jgi:hypothetical protein
MKRRHAVLPLVLSLVVGSGAWAAPAQTKPAPKPAAKPAPKPAPKPTPAMVTLPADTVVKVKLERTLSSDKSKEGDVFTAAVEDSAFPKGTIVRGVILGATPADKKNPGKLGMDFQTLEFPDGQRAPIKGTAISLDEKSVKMSEDGRLVATQASKKETTKYMAYGAGAGLLIGSVLGSNVIGGVVGAGAGYLLGSKKKKNQNLTIKEGTEFGVRLDKQTQIQQAYYRR